jgi:hypothetical protein
MRDAGDHERAGRLERKLQASSPALAAAGACAIERLPNPAVTGWQIGSNFRARFRRTSSDVTLACLHAPLAAAGFGRWQDTDDASESRQIVVVIEERDRPTARTRRSQSKQTSGTSEVSSSAWCRICLQPSLLPTEESL